jgi:MoxR-like ATPase
MGYDGPRIFRAPYGNDAAYENFMRTVEDGVPVSELSAESEFDATGEIIRLWGTKETVESSWSNIDEGDFLLFYRDGVYTHAAAVLGKEKNPKLGKEIWHNYEEGSPWICIIYLDDPVEIGADSSEIHNLAGYDIDYPMGFSPLNEMGIGGIRGKYGSIESFVHGSKTEDIDRNRTLKISIPGSILDGLYFPESSETTAESVLDQTASALNAGKHIIFTGPPGTGKTEVARRIASYLASEYPETYSGYQITTATADWSTFDTVGGYMPEENAGESLDFEPGQVLRCFKQDDTQRNDILIIDEINRSDIDKSFGQLFTLLSGQGIQLPFTKGESAVEVIPAEDTTAGMLRPHEFVVPRSWRLLATMNSYDKTSLYEISYAFMRRFAFIHIEAPTIPADDTARSEMLREYLSAWNLDVDQSITDAVGDIWYVINTATDERKIGPAIVRDILSHVVNSTAPETQAITQAIVSYVFPQLEGVRRRERVVAELITVDSVDRDHLARRAEDILQVELDG